MRILLGVTGGIAAYKSVSLMRLLQKNGHDVRVVLTENATRFVTPLTFQALTEYPVAVEDYSKEFSSSAAALSHIDAAKWADLVIIAPATANTLAKMAAGIADNLLTSLLLVVTCPVAVFPAMNNHMYANPATQENLETLRRRGIDVAKPAFGALACGDTAEGKMPEPEEIIKYIHKYTLPRNLSGLRVVVTAGPTVEAIDPVRYISNRSSGKMGYALAKVLNRRGAAVTLISGPTALTSPVNNIIRVTSASEMLMEAEKHISDCDLFFMTAAVADYTPEQTSPHKIKKDHENLELRLIKTPDILKSLSEKKKDNQLFVGFAAESQRLLENASRKLTAKKLDMIVANDISRTDIGFDSDNNEVVLLYGTNREDLPKASKDIIAETVVNKAIELYKEKVGGTDNED